MKVSDDLRELLIGPDPDPSDAASSMERKASTASKRGKLHKKKNSRDDDDHVPRHGHQSSDSGIGMASSHNGDSPVDNDNYTYDELPPPSALPPQDRRPDNVRPATRGGVMTGAYSRVEEMKQQEQLEDPAIKSEPSTVPAIDTHAARGEPALEPVPEIEADETLPNTSYSSQEVDVDQANAVAAAGAVGAGVGAAASKSPSSPSSPSENMEEDILIFREDRASIDAPRHNEYNYDYVRSGRDRQNIMRTNAYWHDVPRGQGVYNGVTGQGSIRRRGTTPRSAPKSKVESEDADTAQPAPFLMTPTFGDGLGIEGDFFSPEQQKLPEQQKKRLSGARRYDNFDFSAGRNGATPGFTGSPYQPSLDSEKDRIIQLRNEQESLGGSGLSFYTQENETPQSSSPSLSSRPTPPVEERNVASPPPIVMAATGSTSAVGRSDTGMSLGTREEKKRQKMLQKEAEKAKKREQWLKEEEQKELAAAAAAKKKLMFMEAQIKAREQEKMAAKRFTESAAAMAKQKEQEAKEAGTSTPPPAQQPKPGRNGPLAKFMARRAHKKNASSSSGSMMTQQPGPSTASISAPIEANKKEEQEGEASELGKFREEVGPNTPSIVRTSSGDGNDVLHEGTVAPGTTGAEQQEQQTPETQRNGSRDDSSIHLNNGIEARDMAAQPQPSFAASSHSLVPPEGSSFDGGAAEAEAAAMAMAPTLATPAPRDSRAIPPAPGAWPEELDRQETSVVEQQQPQEAGHPRNPGAENPFERRDAQAAAAAAASLAATSQQQQQHISPSDGAASPTSTYSVHTNEDAAATGTTEPVPISTSSSPDPSSDDAVAARALKEKEEREQLLSLQREHDEEVEAEQRRRRENEEAARRAAVAFIERTRMSQKPGQGGKSKPTTAMGF